MGIICVGLSVLVFSITRTVSSAPDVRVNKHNRQSAVDGQDEMRAIKHHDHALRKRAEKEGTNRVGYGTEGTLREAASGNQHTHSERVTTHPVALPLCHAPSPCSVFTPK